MRINVSVLQTNQSDPAVSPLNNNKTKNNNSVIMAPSQDKPENNKISEQKFQKKPAHPDTITPGVHWRVVQKSKTK